MAEEWTQRCNPIAVEVPYQSGSSSAYTSVGDNQYLTPGESDPSAAMTAWRLTELEDDSNPYKQVSDLVMITCLIVYLNKA